jgi:hypothetical protein
MYRRFELDLSAVTVDRAELVTKDFRIGEVFVARFPANARIAFYFGRDNPGVEVEDPVTFRPTEDDASSGLYWTNEVALPGQSLHVYISSQRGAGLRPAAL